MKKSFVFFIITLFMLAIMSCDKDNGETVGITTDGVVMRVSYNSHLRFLSTSNNAEVYVNSINGATSNSMLFIDDDFIQSIEEYPWNNTYDIGMLNDGNHEFRLVHVDSLGNADTLISKFFSSVSQY